MKVVRFDVSIEDQPEVRRVIEVDAEQSFEDFHNAILRSVNFDNSQLASFYMCDNDWDKKLEITLIDMESEDSEFTPIMQYTKIGDYVTAKGQKLIYEYDFVLMWRFLIETVSINEHGENHVPLPRVIESEGEAPAQYDTKEKYPEEITDEDTKIIKELQLKNQQAFGSDDYEDDDEFGFGEGYDDDDLDEFRGSSRYDDDDY